MLNCYSYSTLKDNIFVGFIVFLRVFIRITYLRQVIDESQTGAKKLSSDTVSGVEVIYSAYLTWKEMKQV